MNFRRDTETASLMILRAEDGVKLILSDDER